MLCSWGRGGGVCIQHLLTCSHSSFHRDFLEFFLWQFLSFPPSSWMKLTHSEGESPRVFPLLSLTFYLLLSPFWLLAFWEIWLSFSTLLLNLLFSTDFTGACFISLGWVSVAALSIILLVAGELLVAQVGSSSLTRDRTQVPCTGSAESSSQDHQGSSKIDFNLYCYLLLILPWFSFLEFSV